MFSGAITEDSTIFRRKGSSYVRADNRSLAEFRKLAIRLDSQLNVSGSCYYSVGRTTILASVTGPTQALEQPGLKVLLRPSPFFETELEVQNVQEEIHKVVSAAILLNRYPRCRINLFLLIVDLDGSLFSASVNAGILALADAGIELIDLLAVATVYVVPFSQEKHTETFATLVDSTKKEEEHLAEIQATKVEVGVFINSGSILHLKAHGPHSSALTQLIHQTSSVAISIGKVMSKRLEERKCQK